MSVTGPTVRRPYVAFATKGLEDIAAAELSRVLGPLRTRVGTKHVLFDAGDVTEILRRLTTVDDVCELVAPVTEVSTADGLRQLLDLISLDGALGRIETLRPLDGTFSVTVTAARSKVGTSTQIARIVADAVTARLGWQFLSDARAPVDVRLFLDGRCALVGVRVFDGPLSDRPYRVVHRGGALRPTVAAAMVRLACPDTQPPDVQPPDTQLPDTQPPDIAPRQIWDPFCGSGTILAEAVLAGHTAYGSDIDADAIAASAANLATLKTPVTLERADASDPRTWRQHSTVDTVVANLPWGKQIALTQASTLYAAVGVGVAILAGRGGRACLLTTEPDRLAAAIHRAGQGLRITKRQLGLLGQTPTLLTVAPPPR